MGFVSRWGALLLSLACAGCFLSHGAEDDGPADADGGLGGDDGGPAPPPVAPGLRGITASDEHVCFWNPAGEAYCWGGNRAGQLGNGTTTGSPEPVRVRGLHSVADMSASHTHTCALTAHDDIYCWGSTTNHQGTPASPPEPVPQRIGHVEDAAQVATRGRDVLVRTEGGTIWRWDPSTEELAPHPDLPEHTDGMAASLRDVCVWKGGMATCINSPPALNTGPISQMALSDEIECILARDRSGCRRREGGVNRIDGIEDAVEIVAADEGGCARREDGTLRCFGNVTCGDGTRQSCGLWSWCHCDPPITGAVDLTMGDGFTCALLDDGAIECFGDFPGAASVSTVGEWQQTGVRQAVTTAWTTCALHEDDRLRCAGNGLGTPRPVDTPPLRALSSAAFRLCMLGESGELWCECYFTRVDECGGEEADFVLERARGVAGGWSPVCTWTSDGALWCRTDPVEPFERVPGLGPVAGVTLGTRSNILAALNACVWTDGGELLCWDGLEDDAIAPLPVEGIPGDARIVGASAGDGARSESTGHVCAWSEDGRLWCWGDDAHGQLGRDCGSDCTTPGLVSPEVVGGPVAGAVAGEDRTCAWLRDGTVRCWGGSGRSVLDDVPVPDLSDVVGMDLSTDHACAWTRAGAMTCWGSNEQGQLGDGTRFTTVRLPFTIDDP